MEKGGFDGVAVVAWLAIGALVFILAIVVALLLPGPDRPFWERPELAPPSSIDARLDF